MNRKKETALLLTLVLSFLLFNPPILQIFNQLRFVAGIPILYLYFFAAWLLLIGILAWILRKTPNDSSNE
ncbi:MAG: hypothetical protein MUE30_01295 [Spirosomaceae bacterium]|jgi:hypothetical protein|nr:hypothetical protein [Spirosomataceae bacterium]